MTARATLARVRNDIIDNNVGSIGITEEDLAIENNLGKQFQLQN